MASLGSVCCALCGAGAESLQMFRCKQCQNVSYCGEACQKAAWPGHKRFCKGNAVKEGSGDRHLLPLSEKDINDWLVTVGIKADEFIKPGTTTASFLIKSQGLSIEEALQRFEQTRSRVLDLYFPGFSKMTPSQQATAVQMKLTSLPASKRALFALACAQLATPSVFAACLEAGVRPGSIIMFKEGYQPGQPIVKRTLLSALLLSTLVDYFPTKEPFSSRLVECVRLALAKATAADLASTEEPFLVALCVINGPSLIEEVIEAALQAGFAQPLLELQPDPLRPAPFARYVLGSAVAKGTARSVQLLLGMGADPNAVDGGGRTALHFLSSIRVPEPYEKVKLLLAAGADMEADLGGGWTPLGLCAARSSFHAFDILLTLGARTEPLLGRVSNSEGYVTDASAAATTNGAPTSSVTLHRVLQTVAERNDTAMLQRLLELHAVRSALEDKSSPFSVLLELSLHAAIAADAAECVEVLLSHGADLCWVSKEGETAMVAAVRHGAYKAYKALYDAGALKALAEAIHQTALHTVSILLKLALGVLATTPADTQAVAGEDDDGQRPISDVREGLQKIIAKPAKLKEREERRAATGSGG